MSPLPSMGGWTPGPWLISPTGPVMHGYSQPYAVACHPTLNLVCGCFGDIAGGEEQAHANAHLIAAAPSLYEALEALLSLNEYMGRGEDNPAFARARAALAKARGETP